MDLSSGAGSGVCDNKLDFFINLLKLIRTAVTVNTGDLSDVMYENNFDSLVL